MVTEQLWFDNRVSIRAYCFKLYKFFVENKNLDYVNFMKALKNNMGNIDARRLKFYISFIKKDISVKKANEMTLILKYIVAKEKNDIKQVNAIKQEIDKINSTFILEAQTIGDVPISNRLKEKKQDMHTNLIDTLNDNMQCVINEQKPYTELIKEGKLSNPNLLTHARKYIKEIDLDKYIEFLVSNYKLDVTSNDELKEYNEILQFFIDNIDKTIEKLTYYYKTENESGIRKIYIDGQEKLGSDYSNIAKLYIWKVKKLESFQQKYQKLINSINSLIGSDISKFNREDNTFMTSLKNEDDFIVDFYKNLLKVYRVYNEQIIKNKYASDLLKNELKEKYIMKLLPENNK